MRPFGRDEFASCLQIQKRSSNGLQRLSSRDATWLGTKKPIAKLNVVTTSKTAAAITGTANAKSGGAYGVFGTTASGTNDAGAISCLATRH